MAVEGFTTRYDEFRISLNTCSYSDHYTDIRQCLTIIHGILVYLLFRYDLLQTTHWWQRIRDVAQNTVGSGSGCVIMANNNYDNDDNDNNKKKKTMETNSNDNDNTNNNDNHMTIYNYDDENDSEHNIMMIMIIIVIFIMIYLDNKLLHHMDNISPV